VRDYLFRKKVGITIAVKKQNEKKLERWIKLVLNYSLNLFEGESTKAVKRYRSENNHVWLSVTAGKFLHCQEVEQFAPMKNGTFAAVEK